MNKIDEFNTEEVGDLQERTKLIESNALSVLSSSNTDSLDYYLRIIKNFPILSAEEEYKLAKRLKETNDIEAAKVLIVSHLRLVASVARGYVGYGLPLSDLIQEGNIGLMKALKRFDPDRRVRLVSFAIYWIKAEIHEYIVRNWRLIKIATTKSQRKLFFNLRSMKKNFQFLEKDEVEEIAKELNVKEEEVLAMDARMMGKEISLEGGKNTEWDEDNYAPIAYLHDANADPVDLLSEIEQNANQTSGLSKALESLDMRSRRIIEARWLAEDDSTSTLHELADEFQLSAERIRQIEQKAMEKMKTFLVVK